MVPPADENQSRVDNPYRRALILRDQIVESFNLEELIDVCWELGLDHESVPHDDKKVLARSLLRFAANEKQAQLFALLNHLRPSVEWPDHFVFPSGSLDHEEKPTPMIQIGFHNAAGLSQSMSILVHPMPSQPDYNALVDQERTRLGIDPPGDIKLGQASDTLFAPQRGDYIAYLSDYKHYLWQLYYHSVNRARVRKIAVTVKNVGTATAENVLVQLRMPKEFQFADMSPEGVKESYNRAFLYEKPPTPLRPPGVYGPVYRSRIAEILERPILDSSNHERVVAEESDVTLGRLEKRHDWTVIEFKVRQLIHGYSATLLEIPAFLVTPEAEGKLFSIDYAIGSNNLAVTLTGQLSLNVS